MSQSKRGVRRVTRISVLVGLVAGLGLLGGVASAVVLDGTTTPTIWTDKADYPPGATVTLSGAGWASSEAIHVEVNDTINKAWFYETDVTADNAGTFTKAFQISPNFVSDYDVTATGATSGVARTTFTDANAADLDQCANGSLAAPNVPACNPDEWVNGNVGASKAHYNEGDSLPYRITFNNIAAGGPHFVTIGWDTTKSDKHALDYLTTFNRTVTTANPCAGVSGCSLASATTFPIPPDPQVTGGGVTPIAGNFTLYGGTITSVSSYSGGASFPVGDNSRQITIGFTASATNPVLAWAGHIATRANWGIGNAAVNIPGSPYHTSLIDLDGKGGKQDRSLSSEAVTFPSTINIIKDANGATTQFGFTASPAPLANFSLTDGSSTPNPTQSFTLDTPSEFTTYTVSENDPAPAYALTGLSCVEDQTANTTTNLGTRTATIKVEEGEIITCTYFNTQQAAHLIVIKHVINNNGGTAVAANFTLDSGGANDTPDNFAGAESPGTNVTLDPGSYNVTETGPSGYSASYSADCVGSISAGQTKTCTVTNDDQAGTLIVKKVVINDNGGTKIATDFSFKVNGGSAVSFLQDGADTLKGKNTLTVNAGTYSVVEPAVSGYTTTYDNCDNVAVANGGTQTCTVTNDDQAGTLIVKKVVINDNGGTKIATDFSFKVNGGSAVSFLQDGADTLKGKNTLTVNAGTYSVVEPAVSGYTTTYDNCDNVAVANGGTQTCTVTNDDQAGTLIVKKVVINDNGGSKIATDFSFKVNGGSAVSFLQDGADTLKGKNTLTVNAGTYSVVEPAVSGYTTTYDNCDNVAVANGGTQTCTVTNDDQAGTLIVKKVVINDNGGSKIATDFSFKVNGGSAVSFLQDGADTLKGKNTLTVNAGTYSVVEPAVSGYTTTYDNCDNVAVANGGTQTCTVTNDDQAGTLIVKKVVINDNGGSKIATDFSFKVNGGSAVSFLQDGADTLKGKNTLTVNAGTYSVVEPAVSGYTTTYDNCDNVAVANGGTQTCTVTNDDQAGTLIVKKVVINDNGGSKIATDFSFKVNGGSAVSFLQDGADTLKGKNTLTVNAGTYSVVEPAVSGYTTTYDNCDNVAVANGGTQTCTVTNDDQAGTLIVKKVVINDNGGSKIATDFSFKVNGGSAVSFLQDGADTLKGKNTLTVNAGTYSVVEPAVSGYTTTYDNCDNVAVANGGTQTCTVTNDDQAGTLIVKKVVINDNGGSKIATDFSFKVNGGSAVSFLQDGADTLKGKNTLTVNAGTYSVVEPAVSGYTTTYDNCDNVAVANGGTQTCTVTNDDQAGTLIVKKVVINDNGGSKIATDFSFKVNGGSAVSFLQDGADTLKGKNTLTVNAGTYSVVEPAVSGYTTTYDNCDNVAVANGGTQTCTVTNDDQAGTLIVKKVVINDNGGSKIATDFSFKVNGGSAVSFLQDGADTLKGKNTLTVNAGTYSVVEPAVSGYTTTYDNCDNVAVANGGTQTCTVTNDDQAGTLIVKKVVINDNGGSKIATDFSFKVNGGSAVSFLQDGADTLKGKNTLTVNAGTYSVVEPAVSGYTTTYDNCDNVAVANGGTQTCTVTNDDQPGTIIIKKIIKPVGALTSFSFDATGTGYTDFSLAGGQQNSQTLNAGSYTVKELVPLGWVLTGIGGSTDPNTPYSCTVTGSGGSTGAGDLDTQVATVSLKNGDTVTCVFENTGQGVTRTQGFWATHPQLADLAWNGGTDFGHTFPGVSATAGIMDKLLCSGSITINAALNAPAANSELMGGFWADVSKTTGGTKRSTLSQSKMQLLQQLLAAELNASAFGSVPSSGSFTAWESAFCTGTASSIKTAQQQAASFNTNGDSSTFTPGTSADSKFARFIAKLTYWNAT